SRVVRWCVPGSSPRMFRGRPVRHVFRPPVRACGLSHHRFLGHSGVPPRQVAEWAGHSLDVLLRIYVRILDGSEYESRRGEDVGFEDLSPRRGELQRVFPTTGRMGPWLAVANRTAGKAPLACFYRSAAIFRGARGWAGRGSNPRPRDYESPALTY